MTIEELLASLRAHDAAMDLAPWYSSESRWQSDCVLTGAPDADITNDGRVVVQANSNFPYRANLDAIAWFGTHRGELLALVERMRHELQEWRSDIESANLDHGWAIVERIDRILGGGQ